MTSLIKRNDSKNPATTCKGVTNSGRPCRRDIAAVKPSKAGVLAVAQVDDGEGAAAYFCWQHKDQADRLADAPAQSNGGHQDETKIYPLQQRSSIDTLMGRLGVIDEQEDGKKKRKSKVSGVNGAGGHNIHRPPTWNQVQGPLMSVPSDVMASNAQYARPTSRPSGKQHRGFWASLCCGAADDDDYYEVVRHKQRINNPQQQPQMSQSTPASQPPRPSQKPQSPSTPPRKTRPTSSSPTGRNLTFIPPHTDPTTASSLVTELSKPISAHDEPGFIYIFWLTESIKPGQAAPSERDASSLLSPSNNTPRGLDTNNLLRQHSVRVGSAATKSRGVGQAQSGEKRHILLKIGRANNVYRRMNEWKHQCGYAPTLVRYYPYRHSDSPDSSTSVLAPEALGSEVRRIPYAHKVERLVHIELGAQRVMRDCEHCGKQHREWFEVEASREGVRAVDEVVRRWVRWADGAGR